MIKTVNDLFSESGTGLHGLLWNKGHETFSLFSQLIGYLKCKRVLVLFLRY